MGISYRLKTITLIAMMSVLMVSVFSIFKPTPVHAQGEVYKMQGTTIIATGGLYKGTTVFTLIDQNNPPANITVIQSQKLYYTDNINVDAYLMPPCANAQGAVFFTDASMSGNLAIGDGIAGKSVNCPGVLTPLSKNGDMLDSTFTVSTIITTKAECDAAGGYWLTQSGFSGSTGETTHYCTTNTPTNDTDCGVAGGKWIPAGYNGGSVFEPAHCVINAALNPQTPAGQCAASGGSYTNGTCTSRTCESSATPAGLRFMMCPVFNAIDSTLESLEGVVASYLTYNMENLNQAKPAWDSFRTIAYALIIIIGLVIVVSQAAGLQILDAYTIKKTVPRLLVAVIFIALSWEVTRLAIIFFNDLGAWTSALITQPFQGARNYQIGSIIAQMAGIAVATPTLAIGALVYMSTMGIGGTLVLILTALLGIFIAMVVLGLRMVVITLAVILAPIAIASMILPVTEKLWDLWKKAFISALVVFPIIMGLLAAGKVMAWIISGASDTAAIGVPVGIMALILYIAPYFMIPYTFKLAGGLIGRLAAVTNDKSRGIFDRSRKFRGDQYKQGSQEYAEGRKGDGLLSQYHRRNALARQGGWSATGRGRARYTSASQKLNAQLASKMNEEDGQFAAGDDNSLKLSVLGLNRDQFVQEHMSRYGSSRQVAETALARQERGFGVKMGSNAMMLAAFRAQATSNTAYDPGDGSEAATMEMYKEIKRDSDRLIGRGLVTASETTAMLHGNKGRMEFAASGFGDKMKFLQGTNSADQLMDNTLEALEPAMLTRSNIRTVRAYSPRLLKHLTASQAQAQATGDDTEYKRELARLAGTYDAMASISPQNAKILRDNVMSATLPGGTQDVTSIIESMRSDGTFQQYRREYQQQAQVPPQVQGAPVIPQGPAGAPPQFGPPGPMQP